MTTSLLILGSELPQGVFRPPGVVIVLRLPARDPGIRLGQVEQGEKPRALRDAQVPAPRDILRDHVPVAGRGGGPEVVRPEGRAHRLVFGPVGVVAGAVPAHEGQLLGVLLGAERLRGRRAELRGRRHDEGGHFAPERQQRRPERGRRLPPFSLLGARILAGDRLVVAAIRPLRQDGLGHLFPPGDTVGLARPVWDGGEGLVIRHLDGAWVGGDPKRIQDRVRRARDGRVHIGARRRGVR